MSRDSSVGIATRNGLEVRESNPGGCEIFRARPDRPWGPPSLLYNGYRIFPGGKAAGAWCWSFTPIYVPRSWKCRAIPLLTIWVFVACYKENLYLYHSLFFSHISIRLQRTLICSRAKLTNRRITGNAVIASGGHLNTIMWLLLQAAQGANFSRFFQANAGQHIKSDHDRVLSYCFKFIPH